MSLLEGISVQIYNRDDSLQLVSVHHLHSGLNSNLQDADAHKNACVWLYCNECWFRNGQPTAVCDQGDHHKELFGLCGCVQFSHALLKPHNYTKPLRLRRKKLECLMGWTYCTYLDLVANPEMHFSFQVWKFYREINSVSNSINLIAKKHFYHKEKLNQAHHFLVLVYLSSCMPFEGHTLNKLQWPQQWNSRRVVWALWWRKKEKSEECIG